MAATQIIIILFALAVIGLLAVRFKKKQLSLSKFLFGILLWGIIALGAFFIKKFDFFAQTFGIARAADIAIAFSIVLIFYILFKIFTRIDRIERDITKIVRERALNNKSKL
ncbi:MAG: DUF2304 family protein [Parcubacteria group bacterium]|nr:DUF2304 family protein [Parcubacteria group bacterium]